MIAIGGTEITKAYLGQTELANIAIGDELLFDSNPYDEFGYISKGKVIHFDGLNMGNEEGKWIDLVQGLSFTLNSHTVAASDGVTFDGRGLLQSTNNIDRNLAVPASSTIEIVCDYYASNFFLVGGRGVSFISFVKGTDVAINNRLGYVDDSSYKVYSMTVANGVANGVAMTQGTSTPSYGVPQNAEFPIWVGGRNYGSQYYYKGKVRCVRIYNRMLTVDEMIHNQQVDNTRFNLGLSIT